MGRVDHQAETNGKCRLSVESKSGAARISGAGLVWLVWLTVSQTDNVFCNSPGIGKIVR